MRFFLSFITIVAAVLLVLSLLGWFWFALRYRFTSHFRGASIGLISIDINYIVHYFVVMKVNRDGFYLKPPLILSLFHPPLFIPWNDVQNVKDEKFMFLKYKRLFIGNPVVGNIRISYSTFVRIEKMLDIKPQ
jgi:hypothetical protein